MEIQSIAKDKWLKNWSINVGVAFCSLYGDWYTKEMKRFLGLNFKTSLYTIENGVSTQYLVEADLKSIFAQLVKGIEEDNKTGTKFCQQLIKRTDHIIGLMDSFEKKKELTLQDFLDLQEALYSHVPPNLVIKRTVDYLSPKTQAVVLPEFEKARVYADAVYIRCDKSLKLFTKMISSKEKMNEDLASMLSHDEIINYFKTKKLLFAAWAC